MSESNTRKIIHVDMDAFYASVEQRDDPSLRGRPVAVGYSAKRGVVASASYEARTFGVRSAMPSSTALRKCPDLVFVPPRFEVYRAVSHQIRAIFADYTALIEPLSLDEAYLDVTENLRGIPTASATAAEIRARIFDETGLTASAGISYNKFLAKLASDHCKPNGQFVVTPACRRPDRSGRHRGRRAGDGGRGLGLVREDAGLRPHSDRKDQVCRLPAGDAQPNPGCDDHVSGNLAQREHRPRADGVSASQRHPAARRDVVEF